MIEALGPKDAREKLAARRILAEKVTAAGAGSRLAMEGRALIYRELSSLLRAGMPLVRALTILIESPEMSAAGALLAGVRDRVKEGAPLADALAEGAESMTAFERAIIQAAETSGNVASMLDHLAELLEDDDRLRHRIKGALIYPCIVLVVGIVVAAVMLGVLLPRASDLLSHSHGPLPGITSCTIWFGRFAVRWGAALLLAAAVAVGFHRRRRRQDGDYHVACDRALFRLPLLGRGYRILVNLRFARTLSMLVGSGISLIDGFLLAGRATGSVWISRLVETEVESVRHGSSLSEAIRRIPPLSETLPGWVQVGEASGELGELLGSAARRFEDRWERFSGRAMGFLEPALILVLGGFVLLVTLSVLLPVINLSKGLS